MAVRQLPVLYGESGLAEYLEKINRFPYLTQEDEYMYAKRWTLHGDLDAAHELLKSHLRLVAKTAFGLRGYGLPVAELISEGNIGLMQAIKRFDPDKGFRLSTYAMWWIKASMQEYILRSWSLVKMGTTAAQKKLFFNLRRLKGALQKADAASLTREDAASIAKELDVQEQEVIEMDRRLCLTDRSIDEPLYSKDGGEAGTFGDTLAAAAVPHDDALADAEDGARKRRLLRLAMQEALNDRERDVLVRRRLGEGEGETLDALSVAYGVSRERIRQIEARAMEKIKRFFEEHGEGAFA
jgi:RNA polymerase sigma-32 factor